MQKKKPEEKPFLPRATRARVERFARRLDEENTDLRSQLVREVKAKVELLEQVHRLAEKLLDASSQIDELANKVKHLEVHVDSSKSYYESLLQERQKMIDACSEQVRTLTNAIVALGRGLAGK